MPFYIRMPTNFNVDIFSRNLSKNLDCMGNYMLPHLIKTKNPTDLIEFLIGSVFRKSFCIPMNSSVLTSCYMNLVHINIFASLTC